MTRKQLVSAEDEALFQHAVRDAKPLPRRPVAVMSHSGLHRTVFAPLTSHRVPRFIEAEHPAPPISGHAESRLRRGRMEPEARIDLHGYSHDGAYRALVEFLARSFSEGKRLVLVITGKGGVLRPHFPLWLNAPELAGVVVGIREAHAKHGGGGAWYVALQRRRPSGSR